MTFDRVCVKYSGATKGLHGEINNGVGCSGVYTAWSAGADMVKVFPCRTLGGPLYIKDLLGPFERIPLVAVGGVNTSNLKEYFEAGAAAVGVSESLFGREALKDKNLEALAGNVKNFIERCLDCSGKL